ncbi:MAG: prolyl oligopeptidase family serine peptidase [Candidatus Cloacimonetes bacterium]|nr:prolyl oligopeptidase family serine peptidase [Candidatus Cloacimonadota bacterium]
MLNAQTSYKLPAKNIVDIYDTLGNPYIKFVQFENFGLEMTYQLHQNLQQLSDPSLKLAGKKFSKRLNAPLDSYPITGINILNLTTKNRLSLDLPADAKIRKIKISKDNKKLALLNETINGVQLLIADLETGICKVQSGFFINDMWKDGIICWLNDNNSILLKIINKKRKQEPAKPIVPETPIIEENYGKKNTSLTYQHLLTNVYDEKLFDYYFTSQLVILDTQTGKLIKVGDIGIYEDVKLSPDNEYLLVERIHRPYSYMLPYYRFAKEYQVLNKTGKLIHLLHSRPLQDEIPMGGRVIGPRSFEWQPLKAASLIWVEALDNGDPKIIAEYRDKIMQQNFPGTASPKELLKIEHRFSSITWSQDEDEFIYYEYDRDRLWEKGWLCQKGKAPVLIHGLSKRDVYNHPGKLVLKKTNNGGNVFIKDGDWIFYQNDLGATPQGNYPFLSKFNLITKQIEILFRCREDHHETMKNFVDKNLNKIIIRSQSQKEPPNYFFVDLKTKQYSAITDYPNNFTQLTELKKEMITFTRKDGIPLSGELYLPADFKEGAKLPLVFNAYPQEYADSTTAGQVKTTSNKFNRFRGASIRYFALLGYAVLTKASIPIVGDPETVNETFIEQTVNSVQAAIDYLNSRGIIDPDRVGITGHSYGAFMVANVLAHSNICTAGIARSGAYNRTLTPFGFQNERRTFWEAKEFYLEVSPFAHAEKITEPILLIHGDDDPNAGTYPMQSIRFFQALQGNSGTAKLVIMPFEGHSYRARESGLHVLAEMIEWFDKFVKNK